MMEKSTKMWKKKQKKENKIKKWGKKINHKTKMTQLMIQLITKLMS